MQALGQVRQAHHLGVKAVGQFFTTGQRAVGNRHIFRFFGCEVGGCQLNHLASPDKQHLDVSQVFKQLAGQAHGGCRHADAVGTNFSAAAHFFGHRKRALKQLVQRHAHGACVFRCPHRSFHLAQNLRLAQHHGIEPAGDPERVACCLVALQDVSMGAQQGRGNTARMRQPVDGFIQIGHTARAINFGAVAGGQQRGLRMAGQRGAQAAQRGLNLVHSIGKATAQIERCRVVV